MDLQASTNEQLSQLQKQLEQLETHAHQNAHRYLVVFSGDEQWCTATLAKVLPTLQAGQTLLVNDHSTDGELDFGIVCESIQAFTKTPILISHLQRHPF